MVCLGEGVAIGSIIILIYLFVLMTLSGLDNGVYQISINSNMFHEHWAELVALVVGLVCYLWMFPYKRVVRMKQIHGVLN